MNVKQKMLVAFVLLTLLPVAVGAKPRTTADMKKTAHVQLTYKQL